MIYLSSLDEKADDWSDCRSEGKVEKAATLHLAPRLGLYGPT